MTDESAAYGPPLVDEQVLAELAGELDDDAATARIVSRFVGAWEQRMAKLSSAVLAREFALSMDAVLSIKVSSAMIGATLLQALAYREEGLIREGLYEAAGKALEAMARCGEATLIELRRAYPG